jgi:hypothetical protein
MAVHGWFGDAVRMRCWEDLLISEGTYVTGCRKNNLREDGEGSTASG